MSLSNPNSCRTDTFRSGIGAVAASVPVAINPPHLEIRPRREFHTLGGSDVPSNLSESCAAAKAKRNLGKTPTKSTDYRCFSCPDRAALPGLLCAYLRW